MTVSDQYKDFVLSALGLGFTITTGNQKPDPFVIRMDKGGKIERQSDVDKREQKEKTIDDMVLNEEGIYVIK